MQNNKQSGGRSAFDELDSLLRKQEAFLADIKMETKTDAAYEAAPASAYSTATPALPDEYSPNVLETPPKRETGNVFDELSFLFENDKELKALLEAQHPNEHNSFEQRPHNKAMHSLTFEEAVQQADSQADGGTPQPRQVFEQPEKTESTPQPRHVFEQPEAKNRPVPRGEAERKLERFRSTASPEPAITEKQLRALSKKHLLLMIHDLQEEVDKLREVNNRIIDAYQAGAAQNSGN